jgi:exodeoxyribonuclease VII large subunit
VPYDTPVARRPFDPSAAVGGLFDQPRDAPRAADPEAAESPRTHSVTEASARILQVLERNIARIRVRGEVLNFREVSRNWYFSLKDAESRLDAIMLRMDQRGAVAPADGTEVVVEGRVTHYGKSGRTQIRCDTLAPVGAGDLEARMRALHAELAARGLLDPARKRTPPRLPRSIIVITSRGSAAEADVGHALATRAPGARVTYVDTRVQGDMAVRQVCEALSAASGAGARGDADVVLLVRGGGSREDLWCFNERAVAESILACSIPVIVGVGHEIDVTIADAVADRTSPTPSRAATDHFASSEELHEELAHLALRLRESARARVADLQRALHLMARHPALERPVGAVLLRRADLDRRSASLVRAARDRIAGSAERMARARLALESRHPRALMARARAQLHAQVQALMRAQSSRVQSDDARIASLAARLDSVGPARVLARGYSITVGPDGAPVRDAASLRAGDAIRSVFANGSARSAVESIEPGDRDRSEAPARDARAGDH